MSNVDHDQTNPASLVGLKMILTPTAGGAQERRTAEGIAEALNAGRQTVLPLRAVRPGDSA